MNSVCLPKKLDSVFNSCTFCSRGKFLSFISLFFVSLLLFSCFVSVYSDAVFVSAAEPNISVNSESTFREAVGSAPTDGSSYVIALTSNIDLTSGSLVIPAYKDITLITDGIKSWNITAMGDFVTITVSDKGVLTLDVGLTKEAF